MYPLSLRHLFSESVLSASTYEHVLLAFRHADPQRTRREAAAHLSLGLYCHVPRADLELILPCAHVQMPHVQRAQFILFTTLGALAGWPLLFTEVLYT